MWEKTVMKREEIEGFVFPEKIWGAMEKLLKAQAELTGPIAFKTGESQGFINAHNQIEAENADFKAGIREVVGIVEDYYSMVYDEFTEKYGLKNTSVNLLEVLSEIAKLKDWGIKEVK